MWLDGKSSPARSYTKYFFFFCTLVSTLSQVVTETLEPWIERGLFAYQVVVDETLSATTGPHENAPGILQQLPPYSVAAAVSESLNGNPLMLTFNVSSLHTCFHVAILCSSSRLVSRTLC